MTSNNYTDSNGDVWKASCSSKYSTTYDAYKAFDGNTTFWAHGTGTTTLPSGRELPCWVQIELPKAITIEKYVLRGANSNEYPKGWILKGSNDGIEFTDIDTQESSTLLSNNTENEFYVSSNESYKIYRLYVTDSTNYCGVSTFNIYEKAITKKYLIKSENVIYTITGGALQALTETEITSSLFQTYGVDEVPDGSLLMNLSNPSVMCWTDAEELPVITANVTATPQSQNVISNAIDLTHKSITGIESATANCEGELIIAVSFDNKQTWKAWNGSEWSTLSEDFTGMNKETLESITFEQWNLLFTGASNFYIRVSLIDTTQSVTEIIVDFAN